MSFIQIIIWLVIAVAFIIILTARYHVPAFFVLLLACFIVGAGIHMQAIEIIRNMKEGFGNILKSLGLIIILGTTLGLLLEHNGSTAVMANTILKITGQKRAALAMNITGFIVGLPVFCDSGYIVLSGLNKRLARQSRQSMLTMATSMASGLYAVHCLIPPHPGITAAAVTLGVPFGDLMIYGLIIAIPAAITGYVWALFSGSKNVILSDEKTIIEDQPEKSPSVIISFLPVLVPVLLIGLKSIVDLKKGQSNIFHQFIDIAGDPIVALAIGVLIALISIRYASKPLNQLLQEGVEKAGSILIIIGAGGAFGALLGATGLGSQFGNMHLSATGIFFPFLLAAVLKTAQGSSTVAIITASSIVLPLLPSLGLATPRGELYTILSMGAGSMMISHANDAYFWVIARFSGLDMKSMLRSYTVASILMSIVSLIAVWTAWKFF